MPRLDPLFPECCHQCEHFEATTGTCGHPLEQSLRREFTLDPDQPCPVDTPIQ
jgi:hypothetical protein